MRIISVILFLPFNSKQESRAYDSFPRQSSPCYHCRVFHIPSFTNMPSVLFSKYPNTIIN